MKKYAMMLALALPAAVAFTSCGDDDENGITLDQTSLSIDYKGTAKLKASESKGVWTSDNEFVASVNDKGEITANHVGEAIITVSKNGYADQCKVTVVPTDNSYYMPYVKWGASQAQVKNYMADWTFDSDSSDNASMLFTGDQDAFPWYIYTFTSTGLVGSTLADEADEDQAMLDYFEQYYVLTNTNEADLKYYYSNGNGSVTAVGAYSSDLDRFMFTIVPAGTRSVDVDAMFAAHDALMAKKARK